MSIETANEPSFGNLTRQMNKLLDQAQKGFYAFSPAESWAPNVNLYENETSYLVCVDLSGVVKEEIDLHVHKQTLTLKGNRLVPTPARDGAAEGPVKCRIHVMEIDHGPFIREVELPEDVESERIAATYRNGMLWIELPKKKG
jgi:HSP20 family protein